MVNARKKGNSFELAVIKKLKEVLKTDNIHSTRNTNRKLDGEKVDITGDVDYHIQCKATENIPQVHKIFDEINRDKPPVIWWKKNNKRQVVILEAETFIKMLLTIQDK